MLKLKDEEDYDELITKYYEIHYESGGEDTDWIRFASD